MTNHPVDEIKLAICKQLSKLAQPKKMDDSDWSAEARKLNRQYGVAAYFSQSHPHLMRFRFVTHDDIEIETVIDLRAMSREYIGEQFKAVRSDLDKHRQARASSIIQTV